MEIFQTILQESKTSTKQISPDVQEELVDWLWHQNKQVVRDAYNLLIMQDNLSEKIKRYYYHFIKHPNLEVAFDAFSNIIYDIFEHQYVHEELQLAKEKIAKEHISLKDLKRILRFDAQSESTLCIFLLRYQTLYQDLFQLTPSEQDELMSNSLICIAKAFHNNNNSYIRFMAGLLLLHFRYPNMLEKALPFLNLTSELDLSWFDYANEDLDKPGEQKPKWLISDPSSHYPYLYPQEFEQREVILRGLIDYAPQTVAPYVIGFLKQWQPLPFVQKLSQSYQKEFAPGVFNRIIHACIMCNVTITPEAVQSLWPVLPTYSHTELVAWLYHLQTQGQVWDHQDHQWLRTLLRSNDRSIVERALVIKKHFRLLNA